LLLKALLTKIPIMEKPGSVFELKASKNKLLNEVIYGLVGKSRIYEAMKKSPEKSFCLAI